MTPEDVDRMIRPVLLKDMRIQCRARGISPAGGLDALRARLKDAMLESGDL
jgi:protein SPIRAL1 and related proteins